MRQIYLLLVLSALLLLECVYDVSHNQCWKIYSGIDTNYDINLKLYPSIIAIIGFLGGIVGKESTCQCRRHKRHGFDPWVRQIPWSRKWQPSPVVLTGKFHGQKSLTWVSMHTPLFVCIHIFNLCYIFRIQISLT